MPFNKSEEERTYRLGKTVLSQSDLKIEIEYKGEVFTLHYPTPLQKTMIESEIARRLGGLPRASYPADHLAMVEACSTIDTLMEQKDCPDWFDGPWTCYDDELITTLYAGYFQFRDQFRDRLRQGRLGEGGKKGSS